MYVIQPCKGLYLATRIERKRSGETVVPATYPGNRAKIMLRELDDMPSNKTDDGLAVVNDDRVCEAIIHTGNRVLTGKGVHWTSDVGKAYQFSSRAKAKHHIVKVLQHCDPCEREYMIVDLIVAALRKREDGEMCTDPTADAYTAPVRVVEACLDLIPIPSRGIGLKRITS